LSKLGAAAARNRLWPVGRIDGIQGRDLQFTGNDIRGERNPAASAAAVS
jgi:hypothetical protein